MAEVGLAASACSIFDGSVLASRCCRAWETADLEPQEWLELAG